MLSKLFKAAGLYAAACKISEV